MRQPIKSERLEDYILRTINAFSDAEGCSAELDDWYLDVDARVISHKSALVSDSDDYSGWVFTIDFDGLALPVTSGKIYCIFRAGINSEEDGWVNGIAVPKEHIPDIHASFKRFCDLFFEHTGIILPYDKLSAVDYSGTSLDITDAVLGRECAFLKDACAGTKSVGRGDTLGL